MKCKILILGAGPLQFPAIITAHKMGLWVIAADMNPNAVGMSYADKQVVIKIQNPEECLALAKKETIDAVFTLCTEIPLKSLALINQELDLSGLRPEQVERATNKALMREAFFKACAPSPVSFKCATIDDAYQARKQINGDIIVKPALSMGSRGIYQLDSTEKLKEAFERAKKISSNGEVLVEEFVDGPEFSVETLTWNGHTEVIAVTDKITTGAPHWVEMGHTQPSNYSDNDIESIKQTAVKGIDALELDWCAGHTEVKLSESGPKIIEIGARLGGDFITTELTPRSTGIDIVEGAICLSLGEEPTVKSWRKPRGSAIRYLAANPGKLIQIEGLENASAIQGVVSIGIYFKIGDIIPVVESSLHRTAWVISEGKTRESAIDRCNMAQNLIKFSIE